MNDSKRTFTMGLMALMLSACAVSQEPFADWTQRDPDSWQLAEQSVVHESDTLLTHESGQAVTVIGPDFGADDYVSLAVARNPAIRAAEQVVEGLRERIAQVSSLDDPMFMASPVGDMAETAAGQAGLMTSVSQTLPLPGKLETRGQMAAQDVAMASADLQSTRLRVIADTRQAYWSYYLAARAMEVTEASRQLLRQLKIIAEANYKAGTAMQQDVLRASVELSNLDNELITLQQRKSTAIARLNALLDRPVNAALPEPKPAQLQGISLELDRLLEEAAQSNPEIQGIHQRIERFRQQLRLARLDRWPDLTVGLNYVAVDDMGLSAMANGDDQWWLSFGINLPIWAAKRDAAEREALHGIGQTVAELTSTRNDLAFRVDDTLVRVQTQQRLVILFRDVIIPQAQQTVDASSSGYQAGRIEFLTLVDNWRKLLDFQLLYHQSLAQLEQDFAQLQQLVGRDLPRDNMTTESMR